MPATPFFEILFGIAVLAAVLGLTWRGDGGMGVNVRDPQFRARSAGSGRWLDDFARMGARRAYQTSVRNERYLRQLKRANWFWELGEHVPPTRAAPFWNLETLWAEKFIGAALAGAAGMLAGFLLLVFAAELDPALSLLAALVFGAGAALAAFGDPDTRLAAAARKRQSQLSLEMGFRLPELRSDVLAGRTISSAMRELSKRPGGPFVEELRRVVLALDVLKDESAALAVLAERNSGNEMALEFANQMRMAVAQGNEVNKVLTILSDSAQHRLQQQVTAQGRRNAMAMGRPLALGSVVIMALLIMLPAALTITESLF